MASPEYETLFEVQQLDIRLNQLKHARENNPISEEIEALRLDLAESDQALADFDSEGHELEKQRKRLDDEVMTVAAKRDESKARLYDGSVTASKDLVALQEEVSHLTERQTVIEDEELEIMEKLEELSGRREAELATRSPQDIQMAELEVKLEENLAELEAEANRIEGERAVLASAVPAKLMEHYTKRRHDLGGIAVARLAGKKCDGCHLSLSAVAYDRIKKLPEDEIVLCDQCGRILLR